MQVRHKHVSGGCFGNWLVSKKEVYDGWRYNGTCGTMERREHTTSVRSQAPHAPTTPFSSWLMHHPQSSGFSFRAGSGSARRALSARRDDTCEGVEMHTEAWSDHSSSVGSIGSPNLVNDGMGCGVAAAWSMGRHFTCFWSRCSFLRGGTGTGRDLQLWNFIIHTSKRA